MKRIEVSSSNLKSIGYDWTMNILEVEFNSGAIYQYADVPPTEYVDLTCADSVGKFFNKEIKGNYDFIKIPECEV